MPYITVVSACERLLTISPMISEIGDCLPKEKKHFLIELTNHSYDEVRIVDGTSNCSCVVCNDLPATLPAQGKIILQGHIKPGLTPGLFKQRIYFRTSLSKQLYVQGAIVGRVIPSITP